MTVNGSVVELTPEIVPLGTGPPTREELLVHYPAKFTWKQLKVFVNSGYVPQAMTIVGSLWTGRGITAISDCSSGTGSCKSGTMSGRKGSGKSMDLLVRIALNMVIWTVLFDHGLSSQLLDDLPAAMGAA